MSYFTGAANALWARLPRRDRLRSLDQASKLYLLFVFDLAGQWRRSRLGPFFDFILARNTGISYGLFQTAGPAWSMGLARLQGRRRVAALDLAGARQGPAHRRCRSV